MTNKNKSLFGDLMNKTSENVIKDQTTETLKKDPQALESQPIPKRKNRVIDRSTVLGELAGGDREEKTLLWVDPTHCKMWSEHDRDYSLLDEHSCADLIDGIKSQGKQEFPAIVRKLDNDANFKYEVICGARRHWSVSHLRNNNFPEFKFLIEVQDLTDEQAFRLSDIENRDREDISDYERAVKYVKAVSKYYKTQKAMAERLQVTEAWLSRYLDLASMPKEIINCYASIRDIKTKHAKYLKPLMKDAKVRHKLMLKASHIIEEQSKRKQAHKDLLDGVEVINLLKLPNKKEAKTKTNPAEIITSAADKKMMEVSKKGRGGLTINILAGSGASKAEVIDACKKAVDRHYA